MPNIGLVLKAEITRLARKQARGEIAATKKASAQHRAFIAELRRQVARLEQQMAQLQRQSKPIRSSPSPVKPVRFVAKGLRSHRARLGLSAGDYGRLVGVSAQSIYNWERGAAQPRHAQKAALATLRGIGAREARARLGNLDRKAG